MNYFTLFIAAALLLTGCSGEQKNTGTAADSTAVTAAEPQQPTAPQDTTLPAPVSTSAPAVAELETKEQAPTDEIRLYGTQYDKTTGMGDFSEVNLQDPRNKQFSDLNVKVFEAIKTGKLKAQAFLSGAQVRSVSYQDIEKALNSSFKVTAQVKESGMFSKYKEGETVKMNFTTAQVSKFYVETRDGRKYLVFCIPNEVHPSGVDKMIAAVQADEVEKLLGKKLNVSFSAPVNPYVNK